MRRLYAPVAQLDRASDSGSEGWGFESLRAYQNREIRICLPWATDSGFSFPCMKRHRPGAESAAAASLCADMAVPRIPSGHYPEEIRTAVLTEISSLPVGNRCHHVQPVRFNGGDRLFPTSKRGVLAIKRQALLFLPLLSGLFLLCACVFLYSVNFYCPSLLS